MISRPAPLSRAAVWPVRTATTSGAPLRGRRVCRPPSAASGGHGRTHVAQDGDVTVAEVTEDRFAERRVTRRAPRVDQSRAAGPRRCRRFDRGCRGAAADTGSSTRIMRGFPSPLRTTALSKYFRGSAYGVACASAMRLITSPMRWLSARPGRRRSRYGVVGSAPITSVLVCGVEQSGSSSLHVGVEPDQSRACAEHQMLPRDVAVAEEGLGVGCDRLDVDPVEVAEAVWPPSWALIANTSGLQR